MCCYFIDQIGIDISNISPFKSSNTEVCVYVRSDCNLHTNLSCNRKMEAEEVLLLIMKKLKEYKANPLRSTPDEKARQKNLRKMFCVYTSLRRKERAKQKQLEQNKCTKEQAMLPQFSDDVSDPIVREEDPLNSSAQMVKEMFMQQCELEPVQSDTSVDNKFVENIVRGIFFCACWLIVKI